jgi:flagellar biosynthesis protein FlhF
MRLKTFTAANTNEALSQVREELGGEAIVVSTQKAENGGLSQVIAALEDDQQPSEVSAETTPHHEEQNAGADVAAVIQQALRHHGVPDGLIGRLVRKACALNVEDPILAFAGAMDVSFRFEPLGENALDHPLMLVGPPGSGKTMTVAKLAARGVMSGHRVGVISTDTSRAGAVEQLMAFTRILDIDLHSVASNEELADAVNRLSDCDQVYVDTAGANPYSDDDMKQLDHMIRAINAEPVLVLAAGSDALEAAETAAYYAEIGTERLVVTRLDTSRRLGAILAAGEAGNLAFSDVSVTPQVADGLKPINPVSLARIIMPYAPDTNDTTTRNITEAPS